MAYHGIEKGLTMPEGRLGFGRAVIIKTILLCERYIKKGYDLSNPQFLHTLSVLDEYKRVHQKSEYRLDDKLTKKLDKLLEKQDNFPIISQPIIDKSEYFQDANAPFDKFSVSRHSVRNFSEGEIKLNKIQKAISLAQNAPSSCNRQASRVYVVQDKQKKQEILALQLGNRGFGHLADKILIVTVDIGVYASARERNAAYIDGGMYGMNLLYSLHFHEIGACTLNCYFSPFTERKMRKVCGVPKAETFIMIILIGDIIKSTSLAMSPRQEIKRIMKEI